MKFVLCALLFFVLPASASFDVYSFDTPAQEQRFRLLIDELRCPKCQNTNLSGSDAEVARDLKTRAYRLMQQGKSDDEIRVYLIDRYGDFISYRPPMRRDTALLWFGPLLLLVMVAAWLIWRVRRPGVAPIPLSESERQKLAQLLADPNNKP